MKKVTVTDFRASLRLWLRSAAHSPVKILSRDHGDMVLISEKQYNELTAGKHEDSRLTDFAQSVANRISLEFLDYEESDDLEANLKLMLKALGRQKIAYVEFKHEDKEK